MSSIIKNAQLNNDMYHNELHVGFVGFGYCWLRGRRKTAFALYCDPHKYLYRAHRRIHHFGITH